MADWPVNYIPLCPEPEPEPLGLPEPVDRPVPVVLPDPLFVPVPLFIELLPLVVVPCTVSVAIPAPSSVVFILPESSLAAGASVPDEVPLASLASAAASLSLLFPLQETIAIPAHSTPRASILFIEFFFHDC